MLPLYSKAQVGSLEDEGKNYGLYFEKFFDEWQINSNVIDTDKKKVSDGWKITCNATDKKKFFEKFKELNTSNGKTENPLLEDYLDRRHRLARMLGGSIIQLSTGWRLVSGLGASHPTEAGFIWHRTLGIPYLPGSSLKGMLRACLTHWKKGELKRIHELFGDTDTCGQGRLIIFDALPLSPLKLEIDVMNSHYAPYYDNLDKPDMLQTNPPADYYSPNPVFFLTVMPEQWFEFMLAPTPGLGTPEDLEGGVGLLKEALSTIGVGAKTAVGYGVFDSNFIDQTESIFEELGKEEEKAKLEQLTLFERQCYSLEHGLNRKSDQEKAELKEESMKLYHELGSLTEAEKIKAAKVLQKVWQTIGEWEGKISDKQVKKVAVIKGLLG